MSGTHHLATPAAVNRMGICHGTRISHSSTRSSNDPSTPETFDFNDIKTPSPASAQANISKNVLTAVSTGSTHTGTYREPSPSDSETSDDDDSMSSLEHQERDAVLRISRKYDKEVARQNAQSNALNDTNKPRASGAVHVPLTKNIFRSASVTPIPPGEQNYSFDFAVPCRDAPMKTAAGGVLSTRVETSQSYQKNQSLAKLPLPMSAHNVFKTTKSNSTTASTPINKVDSQVYQGDAQPKQSILAGHSKDDPMFSTHYAQPMYQRVPQALPKQKPLPQYALHELAPMLAVLDSNIKGLRNDFALEVSARRKSDEKRTAQEKLALSAGRELQEKSQVQTKAMILESVVNTNEKLIELQKRWDEQINKRQRTYDNQMRKEKADWLKLESTVKDYQNDCSKWKDTLKEEWQQQLETLDRAKPQLEERLTQAETVQKRTTQIISDLAQQVRETASMDAEIKASQKHRKEFQHSVAETFKKADTKVKRLHNDLDVHQERCTKMQSSLSTTRSDLKDLQTQFEEYRIHSKSESETSQNAHERHKTTSEELLKRLSKIEEAHLQLQGVVSDILYIVTQRDNGQASIQANIEELREEIKKSNRRSTVLEASVHELKREARERVGKEEVTWRQTLEYKPAPEWRRHRATPSLD